MLKQTLPVLCIFFFIGLLPVSVRAQTSADSTTNGVKTYNSTLNMYYAALGPQSRLYNGEEYIPNYAGVKGNPYFNNATDWGTGNITYDGYQYKNVKIRYDLYKDEVIIPLYKSAIQIILLNNKMESFDLFGHHFIYIKNTPGIVGAVPAGFYDELYGGKIQVLCKKSENLQQDHSLDNITSYFLPTINYYVFKGNEYFVVNSKSEFLDAMKDKKKDLQQFIKTNKIKFNNDNKEQAMARVAEYYDHLSE
jgi:hypothetical protein